MPAPYDKGMVAAESGMAPRSDRWGCTSGGELVSIIDLRYKLPDEDSSRLFSLLAHDYGFFFEEATDDQRFAAAVAAFGMLLRDSAYSGAATLEFIADWALSGLGDDRFGLRAEMVELVARAQEIRPYLKAGQ